jgi:hypothetical protein
MIENLIKKKTGRPVMNNFVVKSWRKCERNIYPWKE